MNDQILPQDTPQSAYETLVGDGRKFKDNEALAKAKIDSDDYIKTLETKLDNAVADIRGLREANTAQANMQELIETLRQQQTKSETPSQPQSQQDNKPTLDLNQLKSMIQQNVKEIDTQKTEQSNLTQVQAKIKEKWGDNVPASVREQIDKLGEIGMTMARRFPDEFLRTIGAEVTQRQPFNSPPRGVLNSDTLKSQTSGERTWSWYENLRLTKPDEYYSRKMTVQMHNDAQRLGESFKDGDFDTSDTELLRTKYKSIY